MTSFPTVLRRMATRPSLGPDRWRWIPGVFYGLAFLGVPAAVVLLTGGPSTILFWAGVALHLLVAFTVGSVMVAVVGVFLLTPLRWLASRRYPTKVEDFETFLAIGLGVAGGLIYFLTEPTLRTYGVELPTTSTNTGAMIVVLGASSVSYGLARAGVATSRAIAAKQPRRQIHPVPPVQVPWGSTPPEPEETYWSPEPVVGWRAWVWTGKTLKGYRAEWSKGMMAATCDRCDSPPGWDHGCGIYALKDLAELSDAPIFGRVEMWGDVVEHEWGYRASHALITDLWADSQSTAAEVAKAYPGVGVRHLDADVREGMRYGQHR
ncbi:MAG: hypothetical protein ACE5F5_05770 [Acidimicrobiia bacterium]